MAITIYSNISSLMAQRRLGQSTADLRRSFERLSSGLRINRASDDAAGLAIADSLNADARIYGQGVRNVNDAISMLNIAEAALSEATNILTRLAELSEQAGNGVYTNEQRAAMDNEAQALAAEYERIIEVAEFNGIAPYDGTLSGIEVQYGKSSAESMNVSFGTLAPFVEGVGTFTAVSTLTVDTNPSAMFASDFNNDGIADLFVHNNTAATIDVFLGNGDATFASAPGFTSGRGKYDFGDVNNDGNIDFVRNVFSISDIRLGQGDGTFIDTSHNLVGQSGNIGPVVFGDLDEDGSLDVIMGPLTNQDHLLFAFGNGDGTFGASQTFTLPAATSVGDILFEGQN